MIFLERDTVWTLSEHYWLRVCGSWKHGRLGYKCCYSEGKATASVYCFTDYNSVC